MSKTKIRHQNDTIKVKEQELLLDDIQNEVIDTSGIENALQKDANIFLLNNLMMCVQFFENYERDIKLLRENWFKEFSLQSHHKTCFYADSLFRLSGTKVKFSPRHGVNKNFESQLHPLRIYISSDNIEAAFDQSVMGRDALKVWPEYQFTVRGDKKSMRSGCFSLVEYKIIREPNQAKSQRNPFTFDTSEATERASIYIPRKTHFEEKSARRLTKTEASVRFMNKHISLNVTGKRCSVRFSPNGTIPVDGFYKYESPETRLKPKMIYDVRMNVSHGASHEIPQLCFQYEEVQNKINSRRVNLDSCFRTQRVLNSAAFKGYFCDLLIEKLGASLKLDLDTVNESTVLEEFVVVQKDGAQHCITPVITVRDWNNFVAIKRFQSDEKPGEIAWPSRYMKKIMKVLPCYAVPSWHASYSEENPDYEKSWKLVFPKAEEFLLLHMMHSHIRCYFFVLLLYKSFIEPEINGASFGPKHLMHLLFWKVHKNFLAWPDDRPAETFLNYLKTLYKKLRNKCLRDFFITSRNLFASSRPRDLHMAQSLIKRILENPIPYVIRAMSNLNLHPNFYPTFDFSSLNKILTKPPAPEIIKNIRKAEKKKRKNFRVQFDEEQQWKKNVIKQIEKEKKAEEEKAKFSVESVNLKETLNFDLDEWEKCNEILQQFASHFLQMGSKSMENNFLPQGLMYLYQTEKMLQLMTTRGVRQETLKKTRDSIVALKRTCYGKIKQELQKQPAKPKNQFQETSEKPEINSETWKQETEAEVTQHTNKEEEKQYSEDNNDPNKGPIIETKL